MYKGFRVIDSHCHIYPQKIAEKAVHGTDNFYGVVSVCKGTVEDLYRASDSFDGFLVHSVATTPHQVRSINKFISEEVKSHNNLIGFGTLHCDSEDIAGDIDDLLSLNLKGVKMHPDIQKFKLDDDNAFKIFAICEQKKLPVLLHTGDKRYDYSNPNRLIPVLETFKNLTVIGAHFGGYSVWETAYKALYKYDNFYVDCSSSLPYISDELAVKMINKYGTDKVLFGTDYPMHDPKQELEHFLSLGYSKEEYQNMLANNLENMLKNNGHN